MKISVLIAAHRAQALLPQALASVADQTHADWELVVAEYDSHDGTKELVEAFAEGQRSVRYQHLPTTHTSAAARNRLLELATGEAVAFLEPGDQWLPRHLSSAELQFDAGADVVVANVMVFDPRSGRDREERVVPAQMAASAVRCLFTRDAIPCISSVAVRRSRLLAVGQFDTRFRSGEARDLWLRCAIAGATFATTRRASCRQPASQSARGASLLPIAEQTTLFYEKHHDLAAVPAALRRRLLAGSLVAQGRLLRAIDPGRAARCFWRAWSLQPVHVQTLGQFALTGSFAPPATDEPNH